MIPEGCFLFERTDVFACTQSQLYGYGITPDALIFNTLGLNEYLSNSTSKPLPEEGRFCGIFVEKNNIVIKTDKTGQELLYFFQAGDEWAVSNSFLLLAKHASKKTELTFLPEIASGFHLKNGKHIGEQLLSHQTMIKEISIIPLTWQVQVSRKTGDVTFLKTSYLDRFQLSESETYEETLVSVLESGAGLLLALSTAGYNLNPHLSGGYDSRLVMCMMEIAGIKENVNVSSYKHKIDDFRSAKLVCEYFGYPMNGQRVKQLNFFSAGDALRAYLLSCGGTYLPVYPIHDYLQRGPFEVVLTGDQPTGWSHFAGNAQFNGTAEKIAEDIVQYMRNRNHGEKLKEYFYSTFDVLGIEPDHPAAMLAHYNAIRSRHHCGRNWYKSMGSRILFTPLMDSRFIAMDLFNLKNGFHPTKIFIDAFSATGQWAMTIPFETPSRRFDENLVNNSPFKDGVALSPKKYTIYGTPESQTSEDLPDIFDIPIETGFNDEMMKVLLSRSFYASKQTWQSDVFTEKDIARAREEIKNEGTLSHGYRMVAHILSVDMIQRILNKNKSF